jgi:hypothetical protein
MWRFRVSHLAQCAPGATPQFLYRGARLLTDSPMTWDEVRRMGDRMAAHLERRAATAGEFGASFTTLEPWADRFSGDGRVEARVYLAAGTMAQYQTVMPSRLRLRNDPTRPFLERMPNLKLQPETGLEWCLSRFAWTESRTRKSMDVTPARADGLIQLSIKDAALNKMTDTAGWDVGAKARYEAVRYDRLNPVERAVMLYVYSCPPGPPSGPDVGYLSQQVRLAFADAGSERLTGLMPWLGWAELNMGGLAQAAGAPSPVVPAAVALRQMRASVWEHQLTRLDAGDDGADMVGGIVFTSGTSSPLPTWQCIRPVAFIATMLADLRLTETSEQKLELARLLQAFGFVRQLQVDESCGWMCPNPEAAIGGIRASTWDTSMPADATSFALLATCELLKSMDKLAAAEGAKGPQANPVGEPHAEPRPRTP